MKVYVIPVGTKVALGDGDGELLYMKITKEISFTDFVSDPIYLYNNRTNDKIKKELNKDPVIKTKGNQVAKYVLENNFYNYLYVNYADVKVLC